MGESDEAEAGQDHWERQPLPHCRASQEESDMRIRLPIKFPDDAREPIADKEDSGEQAGSPLCAHKSCYQQKNKQQQPLHTCLIELAWMTRLRPGVRENHAPGHIGDAPIELAVDEIGDSAQEKADGGRRSNNIAEGK